MPDAPLSASQIVVQVYLFLVRYSWPARTAPTAEKF
jgi:hypothetical protein